MLRIAPVVVVVLASITLPLNAAAKTFVFDHLLDVTDYGITGSGTGRGLTTAGADLLVSDALDDQIFRIDPSAPPALLATYETDPFACAPLATCVPTQEWGRVIWDVAWDGSSLWAVDKQGSNPTWLIELDDQGRFEQRLDASIAGAAPGGLAYDPRGGGALLVTDVGSDSVTHLDTSGTALGISSLAAQSGAPTGIAHFGDDLFFVTDSADDTVYEFELPSGGGAATFVGETIFLGFDVSTLTSLESVAYDAANETLYLLDTPSVDASNVYAFTLIPEPGTGLLLALGLVGIAARRREA